MQVHFTTGNPALGADHLHRGSIHLTQAPQSLAERDYGQALPDANLRRATVALVGVPSRFVPTDVVELLAPFRNSVQGDPNLPARRAAAPAALTMYCNHSVLIKTKRHGNLRSVTRDDPSRRAQTSDGCESSRVAVAPAPPPTVYVWSVWTGWT